MYKQQTLLQSFNNALKGLVYAIREERNMRVAIAFIPPVVSYGFFAGLTKIEFAIIIICISIVCLSEIINSSIENTIDSTIKEFNPLAGKAKDMGAAVTLTASAMAMVVGFIILYKPDKLLALIQLFKNPWFLICTTLYLVIGFLFIFTKRIRNN